MEQTLRNELIKLGGTIEGRLIREWLSDSIQGILEENLKATTLKQLQGNQVAIKKLRELFSFLNTEKPKEAKTNQYL